jgi:rhamnulokinase
MVEPNTIIGKLSIDVAGYVCDICAVSSHDTASAVYGNNIQQEEIFLSSGTWSLLGVMTQGLIKNENAYNAKFSNEGSINGIRFLKNIMGLWMYNSLRKEMDPDAEIIELTKKISARTYSKTFDANDSSLFAPKSMRKAILDLLGETDLNNYDIYFSMFNSLANAYYLGIKELELITNQTYKRFVVFGGGSQNKLLNKLILQKINKEVIFGEPEATALGNIKSQIEVIR